MYRLKNSVYVISPELYVMDDQGNLIELADHIYSQLLYSVYGVLA